MRKRKLYKILPLIYLLISLVGFGADFTLEDLQILRDSGNISQEDYELLVQELETGGEVVQDNAYKLKINGKLVSNTYKLIVEEGREYFDIKEFFSLIKFTNYNIKKDGIEFFLGTNLDRYYLDVKTNRVYNGKKELVKDETYKKVILKDDIFFVEKEIFKEIFLNRVNVDIQRLEIDMVLAFTPPVAIEQMLDLAKYQLENQVETPELVFTGKRSLFDLGYVNFQADQNFTKGPDDSKFERDWSGNLSYQGGFLYGQLQFDYDLKEKKASNFNLEYKDIWKEHSLDINRGDFDSGDSGWTFKFYKDQGFMITGSQVTIRERVPVGTRVELLYMGAAIAIQDEENGEVVFNDKRITSDREYTLKFYYPDGRIEEKIIKTSNDYNKQNKDEIEYDITLTEDTENNSYTTDANMYYGVTENLTVGVGYSREVTRKGEKTGDKDPTNPDDTTPTTEKEGSKAYSNTVNAEVVYGNTYNGYSYTVSANTEVSLNDYTDTSGKNLKDKKSYGYLAEVSKDKWRVTYSEDMYGPYYEEKKNKNLSLNYDLTERLRVTYDYGETKNRDGEMSKERSVGLTYDYNYKDILFSSSASFDMYDDKNNEYSINAYKTFSNKVTTRWENTWIENGKHYETSLSLYNNNIGGFLDASLDLRYSDKDKESIGFTFSVTMDSWFSFDANADREGNRSVSIGVDKIIDLRDPLKKVESTDISRANIITFIDVNNNIYDDGEPVVPDVDVKIGQTKVTTDKNGRAKIKGLSNGVIHDVEVTIKKPSYVVDSQIKILSHFNSEVEVNIPVKPMMNLSGYVLLDKSLGLRAFEIEEFYSNIVIQILDKNGREIDITVPDNTGYFDISGLFPEDYVVKVFYTGDRFEIVNLSELLSLTYDAKKGFDFAIDLRVSDKQIVLDQN